MSIKNKIDAGWDTISANIFAYFRYFNSADRCYKYVESCPKT